MDYSHQINSLDDFPGFGPETMWGAFEAKQDPTASSSWVISFEDSQATMNPNFEQEIYGTEDFSFQCVEEGDKKTRNAHEHVLSERKRRQKISQLFIALSAVLPGLKKIDKASILEDAVKHLKQLQERVKMLEEEPHQTTTDKFVVKKTHIYTDDDTFSSESCRCLPEIQVKGWDRDVMIRIQCEKIKGFCITRVLNEVEKLHLSVVNTNVLPFGNSLLDITIVAQMKYSGLRMQVKDLEKSLTQTLMKML